MTIELTQKDADTILFFLREELQKETDNFNNYMKEYNELQEDKDPLALLLKEIITEKNCKDEYEKAYIEKKNKLLKFIELLTIGSEAA